MTEPPRMRAGTADRQAAVDRLSGHFADGRLDADEFDQRVAAAYRSTYLDELTPLFTDLPQARPERPAWAQGPGPRPLPGTDGDRYRTGGPWGPRGRRPGPPPPIRLALFVLLVVMIIWSVGAVGHGIFPFPLLWLVIGLLLFSRSRHRRREHHR